MRPRFAFGHIQAWLSYIEMRPIRWLAIICVVGLLFYGASPYFAFWRFTVAVESRDAAAISSRVDFPAVRASLKKQLVVRFARQASGHKRWNHLGPTLIDAIIDVYITPEGIAALVSNPEALQSLKAPRQFHFTLGKPVKAWNVKYAFFTGLGVLWSTGMESSSGSILLAQAGASTISISA
jgi:hypothetical protein